mmetsp:Transcript_28014/g.70909  ORF Transcript_28014/g.70909 Transcript_28014/m.70909 type:complete len:1092 (-) Transcript_28014:290-3565(-)|eukprot:CAMPEP_0174917364 /NCGR_PEP_ID=MMETSP1355-20121228/2397_1 /TAXON_ID=464990 /ORGANISM="Hemiselmis tepida, Strain CCMP443" /LENGTH=1091 /DNA_ID=CAMNT_0016162441 /DNA_START=114 /DNA_END=3389 /DNA_ORIENTATION=+
MDKGKNSPTDLNGLQVDGLSTRSLPEAAETPAILGPLAVPGHIGDPKLPGSDKMGQIAEGHGEVDDLGGCKSIYDAVPAPLVQNEMVVIPEEDQESTYAGGCFGGFIWLVATYPIVLALFVPLIACVIMGAVGIPPYPAFVEGNRARNSLGAQQFDAYVAARTDWLDQSGAGGNAASPLGVGSDDENKEYAIFTQEQTRQSINVWFESKSGNILSEENVASQKRVLDGFQGIIAGFCQRKSPTDSSCREPASIFSATGKSDRQGLVDSLKNANDVQKDRWKNWLGANVNFDEGTGWWTKARVRVGGPLQDFKNISHLDDEQSKIYEAEYKAPGFTGLPTRDGWIAKMNDIVKDEASKNPDLKVRFSSFPMIGPVFFAALLRDALLSIGALFAVGIIIWLQVGSVLLSVAAMVEIVVSFVLTLSTWRIIGNESFTFIQVLVIFIILGIGADDVFVFMDAWKQSRLQPKKISGSLRSRLQWTWARAFAAMLVTTSTTIGALCLTSIIDVPSIATFGTFAAIVVFWNFFFCVVWFPNIVVLHDMFVVRGCNDGCCAKRVCGCCCQSCTNNWFLEDGGKSAHEDRKDDIRALERFFKYTLHGFIMNKTYRYCLFAGFFVIALIGVVLAATQVDLTDKSLTESFLKESSDIQQMFNLLLGNSLAFQATSDGRKRAGHVAYGIQQNNPIDRSGTYALGEGDQIGVPVFRETADLNSAAFQTHLVETCDKIRELPSVAKRVADKTPESMCFMSDFKAYRLAKGLPFPTAPETLVADLRAWRAERCTLPGCYKNAEGTGVANLDRRYDVNTGFLVDETDDKRIAFAFVSGNLTIPYLEQQLSVIEPEYDEWRNLGDAQNKDGLEPFGITDRTDWIVLMHTLINGVVTGVPIAMLVALFVLILATGNIWVSLCATLTIVGVMASFFITFVAIRGKLGYYECMFLQITVGMSVDYVVHLAHSFNMSPRHSREEKMQDSLGEMGISVFSGAITTLAASGLLFGCEFNVFFQYGSFIFFVILWSIIWAMLFFPAMMIQFGPNSRSGDIAPIRWVHKQLCSGMGEEDHGEPVKAMGVHVVPPEMAVSVGSSVVTVKEDEVSPKP